MPNVVNIAAYKFVALDDLPALRGELRSLCMTEQLRGTILLSEEGVNLFVAGSRAGIDVLLARLRAVMGLEDLQVKESLSEQQPFNRMLVKIKREIIAFGVDNIDPRQYTSRRLSPRELKRWLDEGRPVTLLDTRNDFEVDVGTFACAVPVGVDDFRSFPTAVERLPDELKDQPVVTFCTGGIRCEKAAPYLEQAGFAEVYQLDGGILKYFEQCGGEHYVGECFVFDKRVAVDANLRESELEMCFVCQRTLTQQEQASPQYVVGVSCPHCYQEEERAQAALLAERHAAIRAASDPLPGSAPYDNVRPISVPERFDGWELLDFLDAMKTRLTREAWEDVCAAGHLTFNAQPVSPGLFVRAGERFQHLMPATREPDVNADIEVLYEDDAIVVINKPAPLPVHPCGRFNRNTLTYILHLAYHPLRLRPAHRLDADTTGVMVLSKTRQVARRLQPQFESGNVNKTYLARVLGEPPQDTFACHLPLSDSPGPGGVRLPDENGVPASTRFAARKTFDDGTTLLEITPLTGRTNQIRAHLWALGTPIVGDPIYLPDGQIEKVKSLDVEAQPLCLHAAELAILHPDTGARIIFSAPPPNWANSIG